MADSRKEQKKKKKPNGSNRFYRILATILIIAGLGILGYTGAQHLMVNYRQKQLREAFEASAGFRFLAQEVKEEEIVAIHEWQPMRLIAPAIDMDLMAVGGGDVFDKKLLDQGPTHFQMSDLPNTEGGNVAFAGHRAGRWNFFLDLDKLEEGDDIYLDVAGYRFHYEVEWVRVFDKYDWSPIYSTDYPAITLQTCEPPHVSNPDYRLMVRGALVEVVPAPVEAPQVN
ncbi:MAG TPA: class E sortase [Firmicutes bacterium]|nr:class E sortase [Bacillota bacterium]